MSAERAAVEAITCVGRAGGCGGDYLRRPTGQLWSDNSSGAKRGCRQAQWIYATASSKGCKRRAAQSV